MAFVFMAHKDWPMDKYTRFIAEVSPFYYTRLFELHLNILNSRHLTHRQRQHHGNILDALIDVDVKYHKDMYYASTV